MIKIKMHYLCERCFNIVSMTYNIDAGEEEGHILSFRDDAGLVKFCPNCKRTEYHFTVDDSMEKAIQCLNRHMLKTEYSCAGHFTYYTINNSKVDVDVSSPYIVFSKDIFKREDRTIVNRFNRIIESIEANTNFRLESMNSKNKYRLYNLEFENKVDEFFRKEAEGKVSIADYRVFKNKIDKFILKDNKRLQSILHRELD